ncbi:MAG: glycosyltransferase family 39 protein [Victivallaceae bacterium]|nr:glycosyltransferase family 39 protein [Victivallaceae bacterium]
MLREEKKFSKAGGILLLVLSFFVLYSPLQLGERELYWQEGFHAAQAQEMSLTLPITVAHGEVINNSFPLYPWLASLSVHYLELPMEFALRGISVLALALIACIVWRATLSAGGIQAALVAAAMVISTNIIIDKGPEGYPQTLMTVFMLVGWILWFNLGFGRGSWDKAWLVALFFGGLAFYTGGFQALLYFALPFVFMRRPLGIWKRLNRSGFWSGLAVLFGFILLWGIPYILLSGKLPFTSFSPGNQLGRYLEHLLSFPLDMMLRIAPWQVLAWAPFCVALFPLDSTPIYSRFLRTIVISLFFGLWLNPFSEPRDMVILLPALSILCGLNYWIVARRYGDRIIKICSIPAGLLIIPAAIMIVFYFIPAEWGLQQLKLERGYEFRELLQNRIACGVGATLLVIIAGFLTINGRLRPLWCWVLMISVSCAIFSWGLIVPYRAQENEKRALGVEIRKALKDESVSDQEIIYKAKILDLYSECYYMGWQAQKISSLQELPEHQKTVYLITTEFPQDPSRRWRNLLPERMKYRSQRLCLYQGILTDNAGDQQ